MGVTLTGLLSKFDMMFSSVYADYKKFVKYLSVGIIATLADWSFFFMFINFTELFYLYALAASYFIGMVISFFLNKRYTFNNTYQKVHFQFATFAIVAMIGLALNEVLFFGFVHYIFASMDDFSLMASRVIVTLIVFVWNFIANKRTTFKIFQ